MTQTIYQTQRSKGKSKIPQRVEAFSNNAPVQDSRDDSKFFRGKPSKDKQGNYIP
jgi:hypothetical protein